MTSMQEALTEALEHPITELPPHSIKKRRWQGQTSKQSSDALQRGLNHRDSELGLFVCGGRGKQSRKTPEELRMISRKQGLDGERLIRTSRLTAKIDNNCIVDGFQIYLHSFVVAANGEWTVV